MGTKESGANGAVRTDQREPKQRNASVGPHRCVGDPDFLVIFHSDNFGRRCRLDRKYIKPIYKILREDIGVPVMKPLLERFLASADRPSFLPLR